MERTRVELLVSTLRIGYSLTSVRGTESDKFFNSPIPDVVKKLACIIKLTPVVRVTIISHQK